MENANSRDYLEKIKTQVISNLRKTGTPSVQMTDVPRTTITGGTDEDEDMADDIDEDENKDVRSTKRQWDQRITRDDELDESDDEEQDRANGVHAQNGVPKRRNIMDYQNANAAASDIEMDSGVATPSRPEVDDVVTAIATEANAEVNAEVMEQKALDVTAAESGEQGPSNAPSRADSPKPTIDTEGDVDMTEAAPQPEVKAPSPVSHPVSPAATILPAEPVAPVSEPISETKDVADVKEEGEADKTEGDVVAEASTEAAEKPQT